MTEWLEYRISVYTVFFYLAALVAVVFVPARTSVPAAAFVLSPVITALSSPQLVATLVTSTAFWKAIIPLLIPQAFVVYVLYRDVTEQDKTEFWPLTAVLFGLPAIFLYGHLRMRKR